MKNQEYIQVVTDVNDSLLYRIRHMGFKLPILGREIVIDDTASVICIPPEPKTVPFGALLAVDIDRSTSRNLSAKNWFFGTISHELLGVVPGQEIDVSDDNVLDAVLYSLSYSTDNLHNALSQLYEVCPYN